MKTKARRYPKAFQKYWENETRGHCGILEADDFKWEAYLAWKAGVHYAGGNIRRRAA